MEQKFWRCRNKHTGSVRITASSVLTLTSPVLKHVLPHWSIHCQAKLFELPPLLVGMIHFPGAWINPQQCHLIPVNGKAIPSLVTEQFYHSVQWNQRIQSIGLKC